ncbi:hypothetical protein [Streptomyces sp. NPDC051567]|uniref:hypothetical protein n=1 Tax=Streptomyces sp. NPDC051567 TaxID=3365660 RepID=UPI00378A90D4
MTGRPPLTCRGCSGHLYAVCTVDRGGGRGAAGRAGSQVGEWEVDHEMPAPCPLERLLPLRGRAADPRDLPGAEEVLGPPR